jgi:DNA-binding NarL/FixJ family response regulator
MALFRHGVGALLEDLPEFKVLGDCSDGKAALQLVSRVKPDLIVMDASLPGLSGIDVTAQLKRRSPEVGVILLTDNEAGAYVLEALRVGADGYVLKSTSFDELVNAMRSVAQGKKFLSPNVSAFVVDSVLHPKQDATHHFGLQLLTRHERSIMQLIAEGRTNRTAAEFLSRSPKTIEKHRSNLMRKLGLSNSAELVLLAMEMGLVERPVSVSRLMKSTIQQLPECTD